MRSFFKALPLLLSLTLIPATALAQATTTIPAETPSVMKGVRPLGMGNAFLAVPGTDEHAMFYNPAAINDHPKELSFEVLSPSVDFSPSIFGLVFDAIDLANDVNDAATTSDQIRVFRNFVNEHAGDFESVQVRLPITMVNHKYFGVAVLADSRTTFSFRNRAFTNVELRSVSDGGGVIGGAYGFFDDRLQAGLNLKILHRVSINEVVTTDDVINNPSFGDTLPIRRATGVGVDLGLKGTLPTWDQRWLEVLAPTLGLTWQDIANTRFAGAVPDTEQSLSIGFSLNPKYGDWQFHLANDFRELNQRTNFIRKWNIGLEAIAPQLAGFFTPSLRIGGHGAYFAAGTTLDMKYAKIEFATYGEEAGKFTRQKEIRRIAGTLSFGF